TWLGIAALWLLSLRLELRPRARAAMHALFAMGTVQAGLGIATLLLIVPVPLAVLHQTGALLLFTAALIARHTLKARI
ncbi:MAG TPA: COX15/CtaA family protein, partial [Stellaceae bacterium]|nr:COX15/CtaA family protein [Stellaceae bacterium]